MTNLRKENRELMELVHSIRADMLMRADRSDGNPVVNMSNGLWYRLNETIRKGLGNTSGQSDKPGKLPEHHKQWFDQLRKAGADGNLALMACLDAKTLEPRSVIALVSHDEGEFLMTPIGHLSTENNPYEAYLPPRTDEEQETHR